MNTVNPERVQKFHRLSTPLCGPSGGVPEEAACPALPGRLSAESRLLKILLTDPISLR